MTEQEARTKECKREVVILRTSFDYRTGSTEYEHTEHTVMCTASDCMMWEPDERAPRESMRHRKEQSYDAIAGSIRVVNGEPWRYEYSDVDDKGEYDLLHRALPEGQSEKCGHCGLGGKP